MQSHEGGRSMLSVLWVLWLHKRQRKEKGRFVGQCCPKDQVYRSVSAGWSEIHCSTCRARMPRSGTSLCLKGRKRALKQAQNFAVALVSYNKGNKAILFSQEEAFCKAALRISLQLWVGSGRSRESSWKEEEAGVTNPGCLLGMVVLGLQLVFRWP